MIIKGSIIILRNTHIPGTFICDHGKSVYCVKDNEDDSYLVSLDNGYIKCFTIQKNNISKIYTDGVLVYKHDPSDNL